MFNGKDRIVTMSTIARVILICLAGTSSVAQARPFEPARRPPDGQEPRVPSEGKPQVPADNVETFLRREMQRRQIPGLQIAVVHHGKIVTRGAYGVANLEHSVPATNKTVFPVHSITKAFTGVAIMQLVEAGKLDLSAPLSRYLDDLPKDWQSVTVHELLIHTSGIPDVWNDAARLIADDGDKAWAKVKTLPVDFAPGLQFKYNQTNYIVLGKIIDKLSGEPFTDFIKKKQFDIASMSRTGFGDSNDVVLEISGSYRYFRVVDGKRRPLDKPEHCFLDWPPMIRTAVGINTTAEDLANWIIALQQGRLFKAKTSLPTLWTPGKLKDGKPSLSGGLINGYALGWPIVTRPEHRAIASTGGGRAALFVYPDDDLAIVILTNLIGAEPQLFVDEVAGYYVPSMHASTGFGLPPAIKVLRAELIKRGFDRAQDVAGELKTKDGKSPLQEDDLNNWAYKLVDLGQATNAIEIFKLNVHLYPQSWNTYDSLAEGYEALGDKASAIKNFKKSLELNPKNSNAVEHLKKLEAGAPKNGAK